MNSIVPIRQIRAAHTETTIRVYQAYSNAIADIALSRGTFVSPPFSLNRMTWIKPSFLWMMYRAGWGLKDAGQQRILAVDISWAGFEWALTNSCLSHPDPQMSAEEWHEVKKRHPVRIQWDPERDLLLRPLEYRTIQIGLGPGAIEQYVSQWIQQIVDVTALAHKIHGLVKDGQPDKANQLLPLELPVHTPAHLAFDVSDH